MASSAPDERTGAEKAGSTEYFKRHYIHALLEKGWSFSGFERDKVFLNRGDGTYLDVSGVSGADSVSDGRGVAFGDFDNDGDTDIFLHTIQGSRHLLFRNDAAHGNHLRVELVGTASPRDAIGAIVTLVRGGRRLARAVAAGSGFAGDHDRRLLFGLGDDTRAARLEIRWPSGRTQTLTDIPANTSLRVTEGRDGWEVVHYRASTFADPPPEPARDAPLIATGDAFPRLALTSLDDGGHARLRDHGGKGKAMLANFWATWCKPCQHEMPELERLSRVYGDCVPVVGVSLDLGQPKRVREFLAAKGIHYPVVLAEESAPLEVFREDGVLLPTSFLIGPDRIVRGVYVGGTEATLARLESDLEELCGSAKTH